MLDWVNAEWFVWSGFVFSCLWHLQGWIFIQIAPREEFMTYWMNFCLSGVSFCAFGYLLFQ